MIHVHSGMRDARYPMTKQEEHTSCLAVIRLGTLPSQITKTHLTLPTICKEKIFVVFVFFMLKSAFVFMPRLLGSEIFRLSCLSVSHDQAGGAHELFGGDPLGDPSESHCPKSESNTHIRARETRTHLQSRLQLE